MTFRATILTLFPEMFPGPLGHSLAGKALEKGLWQLDTVQIRDFATDKHKTVDDNPFGGGTGMILKPDVLGRAIEHVVQNSTIKPKCIYLSPRGKPFSQAKALELSQCPHVLLVSGRYEGIDQRAIDHYQLEEISIGDYVLSGGEIAAMVLIDACVRLISGVIETPSATEHESFSEGIAGLLEYPQYTRPVEWLGQVVPEVLVSGHHANIRAWRKEQSEALTKSRRPDIWAQKRKMTDDR